MTSLRAPKLIVLALLTAACTRPPQDSQTLQPSAARQAPVATAEAALEVLEISPPPGSTLERDSIIHARVRYRVKRGESERYKLSAKFQQRDGRTIFDGGFPREAYHYVDADQGIAELSFPMKYVYDDPNLGRPIKICYVLARQTTPEASRLVVQTDFVSYSCANCATRK